MFGLIKDWVSKSLVTHSFRSHVVKGNKRESDLREAPDSNQETELEKEREKADNLAHCTPSAGPQR